VRAERGVKANRHINRARACARDNQSGVNRRRHNIKRDSYSVVTLALPLPELPRRLAKRAERETLQRARARARKRERQRAGSHNFALSGNRNP